MGDDPRALLQQADRALSSAGSGFSFFGSRSDKYENAADLYQRAANAFRMQRLGKEAGLAFERAAAIQTKNLNEPDDAANTLVEAYKSYRKTDPEDAARTLQQVVKHHTGKGNFRRAAQYQQNLAELYEVELDDPKKAVQAYDEAANWFENDNAEALANKLYIKVADLAAEDSDYQRAIENYEKVSKASINNNLLKYSVKDYLLKAGICHLASGDMVASTRALESYADLDPNFASTREYKLLGDLTEAVQAGDQEAFSDKLYQYDQVSKLDKWKTKMMLRVKEKMDSQEEDFS